MARLERQVPRLQLDGAGWGVSAPIPDPEDGLRLSGI